MAFLVCKDVGSAQSILNSDEIATQWLPTFVDIESVVNGIIIEAVLVSRGGPSVLCRTHVLKWVTIWELFLSRLRRCDNITLDFLQKLIKWIRLILSELIHFLSFETISNRGSHADRRTKLYCSRRFPSTNRRPLFIIDMVRWRIWYCDQYWRNATMRWLILSSLWVSPPASRVTWQTTDYLALGDLSMRRTPAAIIYYLTWG